MTDNTESNPIFSVEEMDNFVTFSGILKKIHTRLVNEGYVIKDGQITKTKEVHKTSSMW